MKNRKKILFDATFTARGWINDSSRSGICLASQNILKGLLKRPELEISLFCFPSDIQGLKLVLKRDFSEYPNLKIVNEADAIFLESVAQKLIRARNNAKSSFKTKYLNFLCLVCKSLLVSYNSFYGRKKLDFPVDKFDIFFSPGYPAPQKIRANSNIKRYTLLHDTTPLLFPEFFPAMKYLGYSWVKNLVKNLKEDDHCFANSTQTKEDFLKFCPALQDGNITVTPLAASDNFYPCADPEKTAETKRKYKIPADQKYIFSLCTLEPRKNLLMSIKCFSKFIEQNNIADMVFVLGGGHWQEFMKVLENTTVNKDKIIKAGYIDDEDLAPLFSGAEFFVYPSLYEGFGLPVLEAMQCGCPVITANNSALPELVGDSGILIDPGAEEELIQAMKMLYEDKTLREELSRKGLERAGQFSWEKCVDVMTKEMLK
jgi:glycosyltransferase involved in cell wall biosynthesis